MTVENEDLRDKQEIMTDQSGTVIEYLPYLEDNQFKLSVNQAASLAHIKNMILTHVYSLRKDIRWLKHRVKKFEDA